MSVAGTYAEALYEAARDAGAVDQVARDLREFRDAYVESAELARTLSSPELETARKRAIVAELSAAAHALVGRFLALLVERGRIEALPEIVAAFDERVAAAEGRITVEALTAVPLTDDLRRAIVRKVEGDTGRRVSLVERVDPELLGGLVLRAGGIVVDGSVRSRIDALRRTLTRAPLEAAPAS